MDNVKELLAILATAVNEGRTVTIKADEITVTGTDQGTVTCLEITVE